MPASLAFPMPSRSQTLGWRTRTELVFQGDRVVELELRDGDVVRSETGMIWLTESGRAGDILLRAGEAMTIAGERRFWVSSFGASLLSIVSRHGLSRWSIECLNSRGGLGGWLRRLGRRLGLGA